MPPVLLRDLRTEICELCYRVVVQTGVLELNDRVCRSSNFFCGELISMKTSKCRTEYGILKCEHYVERYASRRVKN